MRLIILLILLSPFEFVFAQKETSIWYFGYNAGLDFNSGTAKVIRNGQIRTDEGVASICDANGQLLFYTEGTTVWNQQHNIMPNGTGLAGHISSSQSSIIVPFVNNPHKYYIFTVDREGKANGLNYSLINMSLDGGKGDVEVKNVQLMTPVCEKLTAVRHCNGRDIWVIVHGFNSATFHAYLVTETGVSGSAVVSTAGMFISNSNYEHAIGCMKVSPNGKKIAIGYLHLGADLLDFDNSTGVISNGNALFLPTENYGGPIMGPYGFEFSASSTYLYVSGEHLSLISGEYENYVLQYNVTMANHSQVQASQKVIHRQKAFGYYGNFGSLQLAPDGKMYMGQFRQQYLSVINYPELEGAACQFQLVGIQTFDPFTGKGLSTYGLPTFFQSYLRKGFDLMSSCNGNKVQFKYDRPSEVLSVKWDFGDPASGAQNNTTVESPEHHFSSEGHYSIMLVCFTSCGSDTLTKKIIVGDSQISLGNDSLICGSPEYVLQSNLSETNNSFLWQDGSSGGSFKAKTTGLYWVDVTNKLTGCNKRDSIFLTFKPNPIFDLGKTIEKCEGEKVKLKVGLPADYSWSNGSTDNQLEISATGTYWVAVNMDGCIARDTVEAKFNKSPGISLGNDTTLCGLREFKISPVLDNKNVGFLWQNGVTTPDYKAESTGLFWLEVKDKSNGCSKRDSVYITFNPGPLFSLGEDLEKCKGDAVKLWVNYSSADFLWSNGNTSNSIQVSTSGVYWLDVTKDNCTSRDSVVISFNDYPVLDLGKDISACEGSELLLDAKNTGMHYVWNDNTTLQTYKVQHSGTYWVKVNNNGCISRDTIKVEYNEKPQVSLGSDRTLCEDEKIELKPVLLKGTSPSFKWNTGSTTASITVDRPGYYLLKVNNECGEARDEIIVSKTACKIYVPTAFTPNNDRNNDEFRAIFKGGLISFNLTIYNRYGQLIFRSNNIDKGWDGNFQGKAQGSGIYPWTLQYRIRNESVDRIMKGIVTLIR